MASRSNIADCDLENTVTRKGLRAASMVITGNVSANYQITTDHPPTIALGASAARTIRLPAAAANIDGLTYTLMSNSSTTTGVLTLNTATGGALSPAVTIAQNLAVTVRYVHGLGWRKIA